MKTVVLFGFQPLRAEGCAFGAPRGCTGFDGGVEAGIAGGGA